MASTNDKRRRELAQIHMAAKQLGMDEDTYRGMLQQVAGVRSAGKLTQSGRTAVLTHLRSAGWKAQPRKRVAQHPGTPANLEREPQLQKIEALLAEMQLSWAYADAIARRQFGVERVAWLRKPDQRSAIIAALHVELEKRALLGDVETCLAELGVTLEAFEAQNRHLKKGWRRNRRTLKALATQLQDEVWRLRHQQASNNRGGDDDIPSSLA